MYATFCHRNNGNNFCILGSLLLLNYCISQGHINSCKYCSNTVK